MLSEVNFYLWLATVESHYAFLMKRVQDSNYLQLKSNSELQHSKAALLKDIETWDWAALTMSTNVGENCTRMGHVLGWSQPVFHYLWRSLLPEWKLGQWPGQWQIHCFMWRTSRSLDLPQEGFFLGLFFLGRESENWREKLPSHSDLSGCSLQLLLHKYKCTWMLQSLPCVRLMETFFQKVVIC